MAVNQDGVLATGADNGSLWFWDWTSGNSFQQQDTIVQPGSLDSEAGAVRLPCIRTLACPGAPRTCSATACLPSATARCRSLPAAGIYATSFDVTGTRLVTCEADKTIKMWKEDETATPDRWAAV